MKNHRTTVGVGVGPNLDLGLTDANELMAEGNNFKVCLGTFNQTRMDFLIECLQRLKIHLPN